MKAVWRGEVDGYADVVDQLRSCGFTRRFPPEPRSLMSELSAVVFLDFDGTITLRDDDGRDPGRVRAPCSGGRIEEAWHLGRIGSRECLACSRWRS